MIAVRSVTAGSDRTDYLYGDSRGSVTFTTQRGTAATTTSRWYDPYGQTRPGATGSTTVTSRGYTGQTGDSSGLNYHHHRYYNPTIGIFITIDPLVASTNEPYLYA